MITDGERFCLYNEDCLIAMPWLPNNSLHAIVTDPPYGLKFMGKAWDHGVPGVAFWKEALRVLKPGGHLLAFGGTRTHHRQTCAIEDAGFEIRDEIAWIYGTGFPKSLDVSKAIHDAAIGQPQGGSKPNSANHGKFKSGCSVDNPEGRGFGAGPGQFMAELGGKQACALVDDAKEWSGYGTALKPACEPICVARKPLEGTVAQNVLKWGTGALNVDGCRIPTEGARPGRTNSSSKSGLTGTGGAVTYGSYEVRGSIAINDTTQGRWPANLIHDGSEEVLESFPQSTSVGHAPIKSNPFGGLNDKPHKEAHFEGGSAARFFYCAKASKSERGEGNNHPTVKPLSLMEHLVKLVSCENDTVLDMFLGSASTGIACLKLKRRFIGMEKDIEHGYFQIAVDRIKEAAST